MPDQPPERGVIEVKPPEDSLGPILESEQVAKYWDRYGLVLVTNYRAFVLVGRDQFGRRARLEHFELAGNPPYNAFAGTSTTEEGGLVEPYKEGLIKKWGIKKFNLDDLYVRFLRLAERHIAEQAGRGIICYISNFSFLGDPSFVVMRQRFLGEFDKIWIDCMNGDSRETGKLTPDGAPDPSVFSTEHNREGIRVGTAISLLARKKDRDDKPAVRFRHFWGKTKRRDLLASLDEKNFDESYEAVAPEKWNRYSFRPLKIREAYASWPAIDALCSAGPYNGLMEKRGGALIDIEKDRLEARMRKYYDPSVDWEEIKALKNGLSKNAARFDAKKARGKVCQTEDFDLARLRQYAVRPFDNRWCYYSPVRPLWNEPRPSLWAQCWEGNKFLMSRVHASKSPEGPPFYFTGRLSDDHFLAPDASCFPLRIRAAGPGAKKRKADKQADMQEQMGGGDIPTANLSKEARRYLAGLGIENPDTDADVAGLIWYHALAIGFSPLYLTENADAVRQDWPRIPLPATGEALLASATLGREIGALLDTENPVAGVASGTLRPELKGLGAAARRNGRKKGLSSRDLRLTARWGYAGKKGVTMPGPGSVTERDYGKDEKKALAAGAKALGLKAGEVISLLGEATLDVHLNDAACWRNVPEGVWGYTIGGYQVIKKWLSYREEELLGRPLSSKEVRHVTATVRRLAALLLLEPKLDANYMAVSEDTYAWPPSEA